MAESLGGPRGIARRRAPKASFTETNGSLWTAKFPARDDARDVGAWEALAQHLAAQAGIEVPASELRRFSGEYTPSVRGRSGSPGPTLS
ncbi:MAG: hypothetical protein ABSC32_21795 [Steroidobacteraceae bacterium]|jgi:hypothetical protein